MRNEINLREARARIGYLVERAEHAGEITIITRHGHPAAALVPIPQEPAMSDHAKHYKPMNDVQFVAELQQLGPAGGWADYVEEEVKRRDLIACKLALASRATIDADATYGRLADPDADPLDLDTPDWHRPRSEKHTAP